MPRSLGSNPLYEKPYGRSAAPLVLTDPPSPAKLLLRWLWSRRGNHHLFIFDIPYRPGPVSMDTIELWVGGDFFFWMFSPLSHLEHRKLDSKKKSPPTQSSIVSIKTGPGRYGISILSSGFTPNIDLTTEIVCFQGYCSAHTVGALWSVQLAQIIKQK